MELLHTDMLSNSAAEMADRKNQSCKIHSYGFDTSIHKICIIQLTSIHIYKYICSISREFQPTLSCSYLIDIQISLRNKNPSSKWEPSQLLFLQNLLYACVLWTKVFFLGQYSAKEASVTLTNDTPFYFDNLFNSLYLSDSQSGFKIIDTLLPNC